jgi:hypothetical protein
MGVFQNESATNLNTRDSYSNIRAADSKRSDFYSNRNNFYSGRNHIYSSRSDSDSKWRLKFVNGF